MAGAETSGKRGPGWRAGGSLSLQANDVRTRVRSPRPRSPPHSAGAAGMPWAARSVPLDRGGYVSIDSSKGLSIDWSCLRRCDRWPVIGSMGMERSTNEQQQTVETRRRDGVLVLPGEWVAKRAPWSRQDPNQNKIDTNKSRRTFSYLSMNLLIMVRRSTCRRPTKGFVWVGLGACKRGLSGLCLCLDVRLIDHTAATKAPFDPHAGNRANSMIRFTFDVNPQSHLAAAVF